MNVNKQQGTAEMNSSNGAGSSSNLTHLHYKCLPSSTALSNDLVSVGIRSFHLSNSKLLEEGGGTTGRVRSRVRSSLIEQGVQLCVSAQALGIGSVPLHSNTVDSTASSVLCIEPTRNHHGNACHKHTIVDPKNVAPTVDMSGPSYRLNNQAPLTCTWDRKNKQHNTKQLLSSDQRNACNDQNEILTLPVRYKELSHDATVKFEIHTSRNKKLGMAVLKLWDEENRLKTGLQKIKVKMTDFQSPPIQIQSSASNSKNSDGVRKGRFERIHADEKENDEKWEACLILDKIQQMQNVSKSRKGLASGMKPSENLTAKQPNQQDKHRDQLQIEDFNITLNGLSNCHSIQNIPWLDTLTSNYCLDVLNEENSNGQQSHIFSKNDNLIDPSETYAYLIVELQPCDFPIVHHEQSYGNVPHGGASNEKSMSSTNDNAGGNNVVASNNSAIGSITPIDLSLYHHEFTRVEMHNSYSEELNKYIVQMPHPVHALNESQEMGMKLIQVLDFESVEDNPVEDKYRTLQHDLLRGLVDPALKPDAHERSQLNTIINGTSQHLSREEKGERRLGFSVNFEVHFVLYLMHFSKRVPFLRSSVEISIQSRG